MATTEPQVAKPEQWQHKCALFFGGFAISLILRTVRFSFEDETGLLARPDEHPTFIVCLWHNRLFCMPALKKRLMPRRKMAVLASPSKDGAWLAWAAGKFGLASIRGSSSRRGVRAMMELKRAMDAGWDIAVTPDGPRGPRYEMHSGAPFLAQLTGAPILLATVEYDNCWRLPSWDGFMIPFPFTRARFHLKGPLKIPAGLDADALELERSNLEHALMAITNEQ